MANEFIRLMPADSLVDDRSDQTIGGIKSFSNLTKFLSPEGVYLDRIHSLDSKTILDKTATQLSVGHSELDLVLNSKSKPTWNQSDLALVSDIPTKISQLTDDSKFLRYTQQSLTDNEKSIVRANIGAGTSNLTVNDVKTVKVDSAVNADSAGKVGHQLSILSGDTSTIVFDGSADRKVDFSTNDFSLESVDGKVNISLLDKGYATVTQVNAKYTKPENGIPLNDLAQSVRASLSKADTALQANALDNYALKSYVDGKIPTKTSQLTNDSSFLQFIAQSLTDTQKQQARTNIGAGTSNLTTNDVKLVKVDNAVNADSATSAGKALSADKAKNADNAVNAEKALNADHATSADSAVSADHATSADSATTATRATNADKALSADSAGKVINKFYVHDEDKSTSIAFDGSGDKNLYFKNDFLIEKDSTSYHVQLKDSGVVAGTYNSVTIDSKGRVTSGTNQPYGGYTKPSGGIPKSDLASSVQTSLGLADTAVQPGDLPPRITSIDGLGGGTLTGDLSLPSQIIFTNTTNPFIKMTTGGIDFYFQSTSGQFGLGPTWNKATHWDSNGNVTFPVVPKVGDSLLALKSDIPSAVTESTVSGWGFTKNKGTVTKIKVNSDEKSPDGSGLVDLGNLLTSSDISGLMPKSGGTFNGAISITGKDTNGYSVKSDGIVKASKLQLSSLDAMTSASSLIVVADSNGYLKSRTPAQILSDISAVPTSRKVNGKSLSSDITLSAADVKALPDTTTIPTVYDSKITIKMNGTEAGSFTLNQSTNKEIGITFTAPDVTKHSATNISNTDLNTLNTESSVGWYYAGGSNSCANKPSGVDAFGLEVGRSAAGWFYQILTASNNSTNKRYIRTGSSSGWSSWDQEVYKADLNNYATVAQVNAKYTKPENGIPKSHLDSSVQTSLGLADTAVQPDQIPVKKVNGKTGEVTLSYSDVGAEKAFTKNTAFNKNFGTVADTVCQGNDSRLSNARPATKFSSNRTLSLTGDVTGTVTSDFSGNVSIATTLVGKSNFALKSDIPTFTVNGDTLYITT